MSRAMRSLWALEAVGVPHENVKTHFLTDTRTPEFSRINPNGPSLDVSTAANAAAWLSRCTEPPALARVRALA